MSGVRDDLVTKGQALRPRTKDKLYKVDTTKVYMFGYKAAPSAPYLRISLIHVFTLGLPEAAYRHLPVVSAPTLHLLRQITRYQTFDEERSQNSRHKIKFNEDSLYDRVN